MEGGGTRTIKSVDAANDLSKKITAENARNALSIETLQRFDASKIYDDSERILARRNTDGQFGCSTPFDIMKIGSNESNRKENHKYVYRDKNLGSVVTDEQWAAIADGTFSNMFVGDYWRINGVSWYICDIDYWRNTGDTTNNIHHLVIMPHVSLKNNVKMNPTNTTEGGYVDSDFRKNILPEIKAIVTAAFPEEHLYVHREHLCNGINNDAETDFLWMDSDVEIPSMEMLIGLNSSNATYSTYHPTINANQLFIFFINNNFLHLRYSYWVKNVVNRTSFGVMHGTGVPLYHSATSSNIGIRPVFGIC